ncbi:type I-E CRISPR-associated endonuclease Cas1e [Salisaeta longa]|uniref:type I-E CRISPR-associated endonuclease Cas1e n=1 Tax=Salisaeta longa TaxID=503170 RepID=UPI0003B4D5C2|nr:type I-E CRISPR-associated endonuclease Cas1e [Salisaeta longa]
MPLKGRLGLESARVPQADRHGLLWLERGRLAVEDGTVVFTTAGNDQLEAGAYDIPLQQISNLLLGPGTVISHDALRLLARQQTGLLAVGSKGVRLYAVSMPLGPDRAKRARQHAMLWANEDRRIDVARAMYTMRLGGELPPYMRDMDSLRGVEGARMKQVYERLAEQYGVQWQGRRYDRTDPEATNAVNQAINHAAVAVYAAARIAVAVTGTVPQLGFIHESSGYAFALDIADLHRATLTLPVAFRAAKRHRQRGGKIEGLTRRMTGRMLRQNNVIPEMIDQIKEVLDGDDDRGDA